MTHPHDDDRAEGAAEEVGSYGRVWMRWDPTKGSSSLSLKAMTVLYDAGQPLTPDELIERLLPQLGPYARSYLEAWWLRVRDIRQASKRRRQSKVGLGQTNLTHSRRATVTPARALRLWLSQVFASRAKQGQTLIYEQGRFRPGPRAPRAQTKDGTVVRFTPEQRQEMEQQDQVDRVLGRQLAMRMEWQRIQAEIESLIGDPQQRWQIIAFLARRFAGGVKSGNRRQQISEVKLRSLCHHLLQTDDPHLQRAIIELVLAWVHPRGG